MAFVGREGELARLAAALELAAGGQASRVALTGVSGVGVTTLLDELARHLEGLPDVTIVRGCAYEPWSGVAYQPLVSAMAATLAAVPDDRLAAVVGPAGYDLAQLVPALGARLDRLGALPEEPLLSAPDQRDSRVAEAVIGTLERLAGTGVVLLALEDLHLADPGTRAFVSVLLRMSRRLPLCLVVTYLSEEVHRRHPLRELVQLMEDTPSVARIDLAPLERDEIVALLEALLGERPSGSFVAAVAEGSGGNPLLVEQLAAARDSAEGVRLSESFEEIVQVRLSTLTVGAIRCLRTLAAARRPLAQSALTGLELHDGRITRGTLREALDSGLAVAAVDDGGEPTAAIVHERYAEAIDAMTLPDVRQRTHEALAALVGPASPAAAAWHLERALRFGAARNAHVAAGDAVQSLEPGGTALLHYERALELAGVRDDAPAVPVAQSELLARAAQAAFVAGHFRRAASLVQHAINERSSTVSLGESMARGQEARRNLQLEVGELYERLGRYRWAGGDLLPAIAAFETAVQLVPDEPIPARARALGSLAKHLMLDGRFAESAALGEQARDVARAVGDASLVELAQSTCTLGVDIGWRGEVERGLDLLDEAAVLARRAGSLDELMRTYANRTTLLDLDSRRVEALSVVHEGISEARRWGLEAVYGAFLRGNAADSLFGLGRWAESEAECRAALEWSPSGVFFWSPIVYLSSVLVESRADEEATRMVGQLLLQLETVPEGQWTASVQRTAVSHALWRSDPMDALRVARSGWQRVLETDDWAQIAIAASTTLEACVAAAEHARNHREMAGVAEASELARQVIPVAERRLAASGMPASVGARREADLHLATARGHMARLRRRSDPDAWRRIADGWREIPVPYGAAKSHWWEAEASLAAGVPRDRAREALFAGWELARTLPARPLMRELARLARRARITLPGVEEASLEPVLAPSAVGPGRVSERPADEWPAAERVDARRGSRGDAKRDGNGIDRSGFDDMPAGTSLSEAVSAITARLVGGDGEAPSEPFGLSPRESEVLSILAEGKTNREIAERLFISDRTVAVHVRNILMKLGVAGRVEAASVAIRLGLVAGFSRGQYR